MSAALTASSSFLSMPESFIMLLAKAVDSLSSTMNTGRDVIFFIFSAKATAFMEELLYLPDIDIGSPTTICSTAFSLIISRSFFLYPA
ncbi:hypothetical protein IX53_03900 [Kosmotoga pacifica]|uniref:Uncharacterized protein n=1 Tax=Kosmotoga pacifica TaxID=1330330 RepID=A0A0G2ZE65_9BACT|nr:hypothetical protein IX53_03900 [Kosmotoga pacifica]